MSETASTVGREGGQEMRGEALALLDRLTASAAEKGLPQPSEAFESYRTKLRENRYTVMVAGEAKRGKSTFVNALLGRELLPTDVEIATCQVFRIRQAEDEGYRVRFEDESALEIKAGDLATFGSQALSDAGESPRFDQMIRWIEVDGPVHFLPKELTLLDTPGLGSLYAAHSRITRRFLPLVDAVIFVLNSESPIGDEEIRFLEEILGVTPSVMFIQTMIDLYSREHWQAIRDRNERILAEKLGERLPDRRVWPISSTNLLKAARTGDVDYEEVAKYRPLATALQSFLFRAAGWSRAAQAVVLARQYHHAGAGLLNFRLDALQEKSAGERRKRCEDVAARKREFEVGWGPQGQERRTLLDDVRSLAQIGKQHFEHAVSFQGEIHGRHSERIGTVRNLDEARKLAETLAEDAVRDAVAAWDDVRLKAQAQVAARLAPFIRETSVVGIAVTPEQKAALLHVNHVDPELRKDLYGKFQTALREGGFALGVVSTGASVTAILVPSLVATTLFLPVAVIGALGAGVYGMLRGINLASHRQLHEAKRELDNHLRMVMQRIQRHYLIVNLDERRHSVVHEYFDQVAKNVSDYVAGVADKWLKDAQDELRRLTAEADLDDRQRKDEADRVSQKISNWARLGEELAALARKLSASGDLPPPQSASGAMAR